MRTILLTIVLAAVVAMTVGSPYPLIAQTPTSAFDRNPWPESKEGPVKVFILAGQSNMQGQASLRTLEHLVYNEETAAKYQQWKDRNGSWNERKDVWIWTTDGQRSGNLKPGYGANEFKIGPELGFGWTVGEKLDEQVLLIKTCWGGRSVKKDFLPPSAEQPSKEQLQNDLERMLKRNPKATIEDVRKTYGKAYRDMVAHTHDVLGNLKTHFPTYDENRGYELAGFVWFQGWNDMVDGEQRQEQYANYTKRLATLIKDVRKEFDAPDLPVVIGELGANGNRGDFQAAQKNVALLPEFNDRVRFTETIEFWEPEVEQMVKDGVWKGPDWVKFYNVGSDKGYHYLGSAKIYTKIGDAMAEEMLQIISPKKQ